MQPSPELVARYSGDEMSQDQKKAYQELRGRLKENLPVVEKLDFHQLPIVL